MIFFEPQSRDRNIFPHDPFKALVAPRPIGWISTVSAAGELNLAPYSCFNVFSSQPPIVGFSSEGDKDSSKDIDGRDSGRRLVLGRVVGIYVDERFVRKGRVDSAAMRPIARGGYDEYNVVEQVFSMPRPA